MPPPPSRAKPAIPGTPPAGPAALRPVPAPSSPLDSPPSPLARKLGARSSVPPPSAASADCVPPTAASAATAPWLLSYSMDKIGPLARSAEDCTRIFAAIAGHDFLDRSTLPIDKAAFTFSPAAELKPRALTHRLAHQRLARKGFRSRPSPKSSTPPTKPSSAIFLP